MRRPLLLGVCLLPGILAAAAYGCGSSEPPLEDLCGWLADPNNCYRQFAADLERPTMATPSPLGLRCTDLALMPNPPPPTTPQLGQFATNTMLDMCFLKNGGIVSFTTPLNFAMMPSPITISLINADASVCGLISFTSADNWSLTINGDTVPDGGTLAPGQVKGGVFSYVNGVKNRTTVTATCMSSPMQMTGIEAHYFNEQEISKCPTLAGSVPSANLEIDMGGYDQDGNTGTGGNFGAVKFSVNLEQPSPGAGGTFANVAPLVVDYFTCLIPPPPPICQDGAQDGGETDVDCGGVTMCPRCMDGLKCINDTDCKGGNCAVMAGLKLCGPKGSGTTTGSTSDASTSASSTSDTTTSASTTTAAGG